MRRSKGEATRERILNTAQAVFAELGYTQASVRQIAAAAGVDQSLVHHYFGTKKALYLEATRIPFDPEEVAAEAMGRADEELGEAIIETIIRLMNSPAGIAHLALIRSMLAPKRELGALRDYLVEFILTTVAKRIGGDKKQARLRAGIIGSQVGGLIMARYIVGIEVIAALSDDEVIAIYGPILQRLIDMPLEAGTAQ